MLDFTLWSKKLKKIWQKRFIKTNYKAFKDDPNDEAIDENNANELIEEKLGNFCDQSQVQMNPQTPNWYWAYSETGTLYCLQYLNSNHVVIVPYLWYHIVYYFELYLLILNKPHIQYLKRLLLLQKLHLRFILTGITTMMPSVTNYTVSYFSSRPLLTSAINSVVRFVSPSYLFCQEDLLPFRDKISHHFLTIIEWVWWEVLLIG